LREATGLSEVTFHNAVQYLKGEGLLKTSNLMIELTHTGLVEYELSLERPDAATEHFPVQVIQQFNAPVGVMQTGTHAMANIVQNVGSSVGNALELRRGAPQSFPERAGELRALDRTKGE
jgi:hypothetical protein